MSDQPNDVTARPFTTFNFQVLLQVEGLGERLVSAAFAECDGLEMNMEVKKIREGGNNVTQINLNGPVTYGQLTLKRGMTAALDLWDWFDLVQQRDRAGVRGSALVVMLAADGETEQARFSLERCLPVKIKAPALNAKDGLVAIEEMQLVYDRLAIQRPE